MSQVNEHRQQIRSIAQQNAALVVNTQSRRGRRLHARAKDLLQRREVPIVANHSVRDPVRLRDVVRELVQRGTKLVIVGGGDGTISSIVDELVYRDTVLGILPFGTANSFARTLGIPMAIDRAVEIIATGKVIDVDLGKIGNDYFANSSALGLSGAITRSRFGMLKRYFGRASYPLTGVMQFCVHRSFRCTLRYQDQSETLDAFDVLIANGRYQGGVLAAPQASVESRDLVVRVIKGPNKGRLVRAWWRTLLGKPPDVSSVHVVRVRDVWIDADPPQYVAIDGELSTQTAIRASIAANALKVLVPPDFDPHT
jgi:YegS/Rv2252/BmrU family lipid kinase